MNDSEKLAATGEPVLVWTKATKVHIIRMNQWCEGQRAIHPESHCWALQELRNLIQMYDRNKSRLLFSSAEMFKKPLWQTVWTQIRLLL